MAVVSMMRWSFSCCSSLFSSPPFTSRLSSFILFFFFPFDPCFYLICSNESGLFVAIFVSSKEWFGSRVDMSPGGLISRTNSIFIAIVQ
ncbi:Uncharacterized protein TCM_008348 [Theobroma cacao]|uniref:Uncharacterized protein n=1 Tax=Theobroma cacao TaxID=3641 RepID=A0A061E4U0_THECC|nr:Uncharacterized protein TCM_008348 [Theobroma cacao]